MTADYSIADAHGVRGSDRHAENIKGGRVVRYLRDAALKDLARWSVCS